MNKILLTVLVFVVFVAGVIIGSFFKPVFKDEGKASFKQNLALELLENPVFAVLTVEGKLVGKGPESLILEKDGKQLNVNVKPDAKFVKQTDSGDLSATRSATWSLNDLPVGSEVGGVIDRNQGAAGDKLYGSYFWVR